MIELRTFRNTDKAAAKGQKFLTLAVEPSGFAVQFYGHTQAATRTAAGQWVEAERARAQAAGLRTRAPAKSRTPEPEAAA